MNAAARLMVCALLFLGSGAVARGATGEIRTIGGGAAAGFRDGPNVDPSNQVGSLFNTPSALALDSTNRLYVADATNNAIRIVDISTEATTTFATSGLNQPVGLAFGGAGQLYVANFGANNVLRFDRQANGTIFAGGLVSPTAVAVDAQGNVHVAQAGGTIRRYSAAGTLLGTSTIPQGAATANLRGAAVSGNLLIVSDAGNHLLWQFPVAGGAGSVFAGTYRVSGLTDGGPGLGRFNAPHQIAASTNGAVVVADRFNHRLRAVNSAGEVTTLFGMDEVLWSAPSPGWEDGAPDLAELREPVGVAVSGATVFDSEVYYHIIRKVAGASLPTNTTGAVELSAVLTPGGGFYPGEVTVQVTSAADPVGGFGANVRIFFTTDGSDPGPENPTATQAVISEGVGRITLRGPIDLRNLRVRVYNGTTPGPVTQGRETSVGMPSLEPNSGIYPTGVTIVVTNASAASGLFPASTRLFYTTNSTAPTLASFEAPITGGIGFIQINGPINLETVRVKAFLGLLGSEVVGGLPSTFDTPGFSPNTGYFPTGMLITVTNASKTSGRFTEGVDVFYTTDGREPTTSDNKLTLTNGKGEIFWHQSDVDLTSLRIKAFSSIAASISVNGTSFTATNGFQGEIGIPPGRNGGVYFGGPEATVFLPVVINVAPGVVMRSVSFVVEVVSPTDVAAGDFSQRIDPTGGVEVRAELMSTNDFIPVRIGSSEAAVTVLSTNPGTYNVSTNRLGIAYLGPTSFRVSDFAVAAMVSIPIPRAAVEGKTYAVRIRNFTAQGASGSLKLRGLSDVSIQVKSTPYLVGDTSPHFWYNAGDFGDRYANADAEGRDRLLDSSDVNDAFFATINPGGRVPYKSSDIFNAMDVVFPDTVGKAGGDGEIRFLDWNIVLRRALVFDPNNWRRFRTNTGLKTQFVPLEELLFGAPLREADVLTLAEPAAASETVENSGWNYQGYLQAGTVENALPGSVVNVPIYLNVSAGAIAGAVQFVALAQGQPGDPAVIGAQFVAANGVPAPNLSGSALPNGGSIENGFYAAWNLDRLNVRGRALLGYARFAIPASAPTGHAYTVVFKSQEGASLARSGGPLPEQYYFDGVRGSVWVNAGAQTPANRLGDAWKNYFFGTLNEPAGFADEDSDHDGFSNEAEYKSGLSPLQADWRVRIEGSQVHVRWFAPFGKRFYVDRSADLNSWSNAASDITGQDALEEIAEPLSGANNQFYRIRSAP
jgi:sugar lactone lactonase YvrE